MPKRKGTLRARRRVSTVVHADASLAHAQRTSPTFKALMQEHSHTHVDAVSVREASHKGHLIVIKTTYEVTVDGLKFDVALDVSNAGRVQYHGIPNVGFASAVDLVKCAIDQFPNDFRKRTPGESSDHSEHGHRRARRAKRGHRGH